MQFEFASEEVLLLEKGFSLHALSEVQGGGLCPSTLFGFFVLYRIGNLPSLILLNHLVSILVFINKNKSMNLIFLSGNCWPVLFEISGLFFLLISLFCSCLKKRIFPNCQSKTFFSTKDTSLKVAVRTQDDEGQLDLGKVDNFFPL